MPGLRETIANFIHPRDETKQDESKEIVPGQEIAYSEPLYSTGSNGYKFDPDELKSRRGASIYRNMMVDEQVKAVVRFRRDAITGRDYYFQFDQGVALSDTEKEFRIGLFTEITEQMRGSFTDSLNAVMTGSWQGYSITEKVFEVIEYNDRPWIGLSALKRKPHDTFRFKVDRFGNVLHLEQDFDGEVRRIPHDKVIHYVQNPDCDEHYGQSELREAHRSWLHKDMAIRFWGIYLERSAGGVWVAKPTGDKRISIGSTEYTNLVAVLSSLSGASSAIVPGNIEIENIQPPTNSQYKDAIEFHDLSIAKALLVPNLLGISHTGQTGAYSQSQTQFKAFMMVLNADANRLEATLNEQLFRELGEANFADGIYPKFRLKPLSIDEILEVLKIWNELVGKDTVEPSDTDEAHIRKLLDMPDKGEPLPRRTPQVPMLPGQQPEKEPQTPDELDEKRDALAWKVSFTKALKRVRFTVIDRQSTDQVTDSVSLMDQVIAENVAELVTYISENRLGTSTGNANEIGRLSFKTAHKNRIRGAVKVALKKGWDLGQRHARDEINAAQQVEFKVQMRRLEDFASDYFEAQSFTIAGQFSAEIEALVKNVLTTGLKFSWTTREVIDGIYKAMVRKGFITAQTAADAMDITHAEILEQLDGVGLAPYRLETMIRTNYFDALNEARYSYFTDPNLGDFVEAMQYSSILDSRTTPICRHLDGRTFSKESDNWQQYRPPNHFNCRSLLIAVTNRDTWEESRDPTLDPQQGFGTK